MRWSGLTRNQRIAVGAGAVVLLLALLAGAYAIGRAGSGPAEETAEATVTPEPAQEAVPEAEVAEEAEPVAEQPPVTDPVGEEEPDPESVENGRVFGQLKGIRDESSGSWTSLWADVDTAVFLTGDAALDYLTDLGDAGYYNANYWYTRSDGSSITSYRINGSYQPAVWMYTWPDVPDPGFYGPGMDKQVVNFGIFYDAIYMDEDSSHLLNRYYWFTVEDAHVTVIEEQPRDSYYEP